MSYTIRIPKSVYIDFEQYTEYDVLVYAGLQCFTGLRDDETGMMVVSLSALIYMMTGGADVSDDFCANISKALKRLIDGGVLRGNCIQRGLYLVEVPMSELLDHFISFPYDILQRIAQSDFRQRAMLFRVFCVIYGSFNGKYAIDGRHHVLGWMPRSYFEEVTGMSSSTITKYIETLVSLKVLYAVQGSRHKTSVYSLYEDREIAVNYTRERRRGRIA